MPGSPSAPEYSSGWRAARLAEQAKKDILEIKLTATDTNYILIGLIFIWKMHVSQGKIRSLSSG